MRRHLQLGCVITVGLALLCACGTTAPAGGAGTDGGTGTDAGSGDGSVTCASGACVVAGDAGADGDVTTDADVAGDASTAQGYCGNGTPLSCTNGMVDCCPPGAPCHAPFPFCDLGNGHCTSGACDDAGDGG